ncbi:MAG: pyrimidine-specific ribonucleoside hydrolase RihA [Clostridiales bacterium]|nr:pyrimidine-specific ribonucleoside hydrolase RihA [Clostridiales bacterium]
MARPVIIDCDPGHDDAIALILALARPEVLEVLAVTTVAGNQTLDKTFVNARRVLTALGKCAPVAQGAAGPLLRPLMTAPNVHGETGLDGPVFPEKLIEPSPRRAFDLQVELLERAREKVTLIALGPLTNLGRLLLARPDLTEKIDHITIMGGAVLGGNWSAAAEFNIMVDPEAANAVFGSGLQVVMCGLDVTHQAYIEERDIARFRAIPTVAAQLAADLLDFFKLYHQAGVVGVPLHDPCAVAYELAPALFTWVDTHIEVETHSEFCDGTIITDLRGFSGLPRRHRAVMGVDRQGFIDLLCDAFETYPKEVPAL